jgi:hypothetical protein
VVPITNARKMPVAAAMRALRPELSAAEQPIASQQRRGVVACRDDGSLDGVDFQHDILPGLQGVQVRASLPPGSKVRGGRLVPHRRHLEVLNLIAKKALDPTTH